VAFVARGAHDAASVGIVAPIYAAVNGLAASRSARNRITRDDGERASILNKLNAGTRAEAVALGIKRGLILL
jgi:hypothetical protein